MSNRSGELIFGGSFNPIHWGHIICARFVAESLGLARVRFVPARLSPHKADSADLAAADDRLSMLHLAALGSPDLIVDGRELSRPPPSYSFDTARQIRAELPEITTLYLLVGTDHLPRLHTWHRFDELSKLVRFVVMHRAGQAIDPATLDPHVRPLLDSIINTPAIDISSTNVRDRARKCKPIDHLVPPAVARYIESRGLYRS